MNPDALKIRELFVHAVGQVPADEWDAFLDQACAGRPDLRDEVSALLEAHRQAGSFLGLPAATLDVAALLKPAPAPGEPPAAAPAGAPLDKDTWHGNPAGEQAGTLIAGRYKLLEKIGEGGMGTVWVAEQTQPVRRKVALKLIKAGMDSKSVLARFEAERQALALMDHPNIAKVLDGGTVSGVRGQESGVSKESGGGILTPDPCLLTPGFGRPFFVMEFVKGVPFTKYCDDARLSIEERLALFLPVCHAVQHAHQKGIIHRDLKPSNILVCLYDGVPIPKVIDFGLAKAIYQPLTERTLHTAEGLMIGTPLYMSPEQAELNNLDVDTRTDIYSLGVILYELLTGTTPLERKRFKEAAWHEMLRLIKEEEPPRPSTRLSGSGTLPSVAAQRKLEPAKLTKLVRGDLDWIVMKALEKERGRRYETANGLVRDLQNYLADEPVEAMPPSRGYRLRKFAHKHKKALVTTVGFAVLLVGGAVLSTLLAVWAMAAEHEANEQRIASDGAKQEAVKTRDEAEANLYVARMNLVQTDWENANVGRILELLEPYRQLPAGKADPRGWEWYYQDRLCQLALRTLKGHTGEVWSVAFSADGRRLASASEDQTIKVWDTAGGQELRTLNGHTRAVMSVAFSPDGRRLASASWDQTIKVWDTASGQELLKLERHTGPVVSVAFSSDGRRLASAGREGTIRLWDTASGRELLKLEHTDGGFCVAISPDGSRLASGGFDRQIKVWDAASGQELRPLTGHTAQIGSVAFNSDGSQLASASIDQTIKVWDVANGQELRTLKGHAGSVFSVAFSPDGSRLASASGDQLIKVWDTASGQERRTLTGHTGWVWSVAISPDGSRLASGSDDSTIKIWDTDSGQELRTLRHTGGVLSVAFSADGSRLASGSGDKTIKVWDTASGQVLHTLKGHAERARSLAISPDGGRLASGSQDRTIKIWETTSGRELRTLKGHIGLERSIAFSPDGSRLASASLEQTIKIWDVASGQVLSTLKGHTVQVESVAFSADGGRLASVSVDGTIKVWDTASGQELRTVKVHTGMVWSVTFSADGSRLASARAQDGTIKIWDTASGQELCTLKGHTRAVRSVAFSADGSRLASGSDDRTIQVWDARPWTPELRRQREALGLVEYLCQKLPAKEKVTERIRADKGITEVVRQEALKLLETYWPRHARQ
jgi:WD40 repeat protein/serine/threonine protein kinase